MIHDEKIQVLDFYNPEDMNQSLFRISAFYESHNAELLHHKFTIKEFFKKGFKKYENIKNWKTRVLGYNIPASCMKEFFELFNDNELTTKEKYIKRIYKEGCYLIGVFDIGAGNYLVLEHEYVHAIYNIYPCYKKRIMKHMFSKTYKHVTNQILTHMKESDYFFVCEDNYLDEINAYSCTVPILSDDFKFSMRQYDNYCNKCFKLQSPLINSEKFRIQYLLKKQRLSRTSKFCDGGGKISQF